jgi:folate-binding protein YgfZ
MSAGNDFHAIPTPGGPVSAGNDSPLPTADPAADSPSAPEPTMRYGDLAAEYEALRHGCGLADRSWVDRLEMLGADRGRFLNAYVTCDVRELPAGQGAYGFLTSAQGRILADMALLAHGDRFWLELPPGQQETVAGHLRKYLIADRVEMRALTDKVPLTLAGPRAAAELVEMAPDLALPEAPWGHVRAVVAGTEVTVQRTGRLGVPALTLWVPASMARPLWEELLARSGNRRVLPVGYEALEVVRTEAGIPRFGHDFGPQNFPQETGEEEQAVSYTKGCYLGQEVVARIHYRGGVQKTLCGLVFDGAAVPASGTALLYEGREAGAIGTAVHSLALDRPIGLAILHRRAAAPGSRLELAGGGAAEVRPLPFAGVAEVAGGAGAPEDAAG